MTDPILQELQQAAKLALKSESVQEGVEHLSRAFNLFSEEAARLKNAYSKLQERFQTVNQELAAKASNLTRLTGYLTNILKNISDAILFVDLEGTITLFNTAAQKILNKDAESVLFKKFWEVFQDDTFGFSMRESLKFGISHKLLYRKEMEISTTFVYEGPKIYHGMIVVFRDISEKQKLQLIASRNDRMKELGEMAATVAHEIRNPLGGIRGYAALLFRDLEDQVGLQEMAANILEGTKSLEKIVSAILHYSKQVEIQPQTLDLGAFLKQVGKFVKVDPAFPSNVRLSLHIPDAPALVPFDPVALKSALLNLIFNAIQAMGQGGELTISLFMMASTCQIAVADTGVGIEEEQQSMLFSPFYTTKKGGNGLGLVETQKIVQAHLGAIDVRSKKGKGSTFTITLPLKR
ncbi:MAG: PAS domain S-box protein [Parachlamydiales bacterium]|nr:PAS domain S-box protein [Parachlamydiales bacterium]